MGHVRCFLGIALAVALLAPLAGCSERAVVPDGPVIAVLSYSPAELLLVEPQSLRVAKRIRLRSMGTDPTVIPGTRVFAVAQCGGVGEDADDTVSLVDLSRGGEVGYVRLPYPNPGSVDILPDGTLAVGHGWKDARGWAFSLVDVARRTCQGECRVPNATAPPASAGGFLWSAGYEETAGVGPAFTLRRVAPDLRSSSVVGMAGPLGTFVIDGDSHARAVARVNPRAGGALVELLDPQTLKVTRRREVGEVRSMVAGGVMTPGSIVLRDGTGVDPSDPGGPLIVLDRATLQVRHRVDAGGSISGLAALGERVYAVTWDSGEIIEVDPIAGRVLRRRSLPGTSGRVLQVATTP